MNKKIEYEDDPFGEVTLGKRVALKSLPSPQALARAEKTQKITLSISAQSLAFFKAQAKKHGIPYQVMIRRLLDAYSVR
jgi:predicted DNA binding CopG/RHH family protein